MTHKQTSKTLQQFVETLEVGEAIGHQNLTLVPLTGREGRERLDYILGADAIEAGTVTITEVDESGSVPDLLAMSQADQMILLLDGEELVGAKQNRILNTSLLLRPRSKTKIPVSCVEEGRWRETSARFCVGHYSPSSLRARKSRDVSRHLREAGEARSNQGAVWDNVEQEIRACAAPSPTMAMHDVFEQRQESFDAYVEALEYPKGACGVIAAINGQFAATDVFDKAETLEQIWPRLITGYAMDALVAKSAGSKDSAKSFTAKGAKALLEHVGEIECEPCRSVGVGRDWRFEAEDIVGQALVAKRVCIHLSVFPNEDGDNGRRSHGPRIMPPSRRRRRSDSPGEDVVQ